MPVVDTEILFALSPKDPKHRRAIKLLREREDLQAPDTAIAEFQIVLRARGRSPSQVRRALLALHETLIRHQVKEVKTISTSLLALQCDLEEKYRLSYFDSLIAASALSLDHEVISDDQAFDRVLDLKRMPLSKG
ncbi:MAG: PIN domain-containing protein [Candidatus Geothermarchaeales archaeon]